MPAERLPDGRIRLSRGPWSEVIPPDALPAKISFYERMATRFGHPSYGEDAQALSALARDS